MNVFHNITHSVKLYLIHIWLSISSPNFYYNVFYNYQGYGIKYTLTLFIISISIYSGYLGYYLQIYEDYFLHNKYSKYIDNVEYLLNQWPNIYYKNGTITTNNNSLFFIKNINHNNVIAIDPENKLLPNNYSKIPLILAKDKIIFNYGKLNMINRNYITIFNTSSLLLDKKNLVEYIQIVLSNADLILIFIVTPLIIFIKYNSFLLKKIFITLIIYIIVSKLKKNITPKQILRTLLFASGTNIIFTGLSPILKSNLLAIILYYWSNLLLIISIYKNNKYVNFFRN